MKHFTDYNPTIEEIEDIFGSQESYEFCLEEIFDKSQINDTEKFKIASLLSIRGENDGSLKMIESIKDSLYRQTCLQAYASWFAKDGEIIN